jgi:hypothetical protein
VTVNLSRAESEAPTTVAQLKALAGGQPDDRYRDVAVVIGSHSWAGTSTVGMAVADAVAAVGAMDVRLIDAAAPQQSGLIGVTDRELGDMGTGWRTGRRGTVTVERPSTPPGDQMELPDFTVRSGIPTVIDAAWAPGLTAGTWLGHLTRRARVVVVCRATAPSLRRAEHVFDGLVGEPLLVAVGVRRLPERIVPSGSRHVAAAYAGGRLVCVPHDRRLAVFGPDEAPLPRPVLSAGGAIARLLWPHYEGIKR